MFATHCARCSQSMQAFTLSWINLDTICLDCAEDEKHAPSYAHARALEQEEVERGNFNYPGPGLTDADREVLWKLRQERLKNIQ